MSSIQTNQRLGISIGLVGGLVISLDVPNILLAESDPWLMVALRGAGAALVCLLIWVMFPGLTNTPKNPLRDRDFVIIAIIYGLNYVFFTLGVYYTSTANLVFILAFNPMVAAIFAWRMIGERPHLYTWLTIAATVFGVGIIVGDGIETGSSIGDLFALLCAVSLAYAITRIRASGKDMSLSFGFGGSITALLMLPMIYLHSDWPGSVPWALVNALLLVPIAGFCLALAPSFIPAPQAAMFYLLETVLAPVWVWLIFGEEARFQTLVGGAIILAAIVAHSWWQLSRSRAKVTA